jgi:hypothetical protein
LAPWFSGRCTRSGAGRQKSSISTTTAVDRHDPNITGDQVLPQPSDIEHQRNVPSRQAQTGTLPVAPLHPGPLERTIRSSPRERAETTLAAQPVSV